MTRALLATSLICLLLSALDGAFATTSGGHANLHRLFERQELQRIEHLAAVDSQQAHPSHSHHTTHLSREEFQLAVDSAKAVKGNTTADVKTAFFPQTLDHFSPPSPVNLVIFQQRYHSCFTYSNDPSDPVFIYLGGEGELTNSSLASGFIRTLAQQYNGKMFALEHRFYGKSHPFDTLASENLIYLTIEQALEDAAQFIQAMVDQYGLTGPWVAIGGSYPGALSAFIRLRFPHLISGSLASSAPVLADLDFWEYDATVSAGAGPACSNEIRQANGLIQTQLSLSPEASKAVKSLFGCGEIPQSDDVGFLYVLADAMSYAVQYGNSNPRSSGYHLRELLCDRWMLNQTSAPDPVTRFAGFTGDLFKRLNNTCYDFTTILPVLNSTEVAPNLNSRQWYWQSCLQVGFFQVAPNSSLPGEPVSLRSPRIDVQYHLDLCRQVFGWPMVPEIDRVNGRYGGTDVVAENIYFSNGSLDPWHVLSLTQNVSCCPSIVARVINGTAHCADLGTPDAVHDPPDLTATREQISREVGRWIAGGGRELECGSSGNLQPCDGQCVDVMSDVLHCGGCVPPQPLDAKNSSLYYCSNGVLLLLPSSAATGHEILAIGFTTLLLGFVALGLGLHALRKEKVLRELQKIEVAERQKRAAIHAVHQHKTTGPAYSGLGQHAADPSNSSNAARQPLRQQPDW